MPSIRKQRILRSGHFITCKCLKEYALRYRLLLMVSQQDAGNPPELAGLTALLRHGTGLLVHVQIGEPIPLF
ncbi:MAG: hypothetical protein KME38_24710 [Spirirestis rafaelensis WJT71-NPBG6]|jgi:hypothetical protein|nr:hypothetical protein [Spirirestis rafaelensis WJT71-NPBG6]